MDKAKKFGTFGGVYAPALLTILGVIMYLRLGWVVGQAGLFNTIAIILVAHIISITTGLSISSIATDKKIKAGGIYYMLSRSLGLPMGGAIGATIFIATALSISFYLVGFSESFLALDIVRDFLHLEQDLNSIRIIASVVLLLIVLIAFISTSLAIKVQYFVLTAIALSLASIVAGFFMNTGFHPDTPAFSPMINTPSMDVLFAIFFPAVTGFTVGVAMSGDLKNPKSSIPRGTLLAIFSGLVIYLGLAIGMALFVDRDLLLNDSGFLIKIAAIPLLVIAGIWSATLSSALGGILGGPRIIQALAKDKLAPGILSKGYGINNEPRIAIILTFVIAFSGIMIGDLNAIARLVTMFFITAYAFINLSFALESWASTDFRPSFRVPRWVGWLGFAASFIVMMQIDFLAMIVAFLLIWLVWYGMKKRNQILEPGDVWQSVWANVVRQSIHNIYAGGIEERNWKPNIMLYTGNPQTRPQLVELGTALIANHGLLTIINLQKYEEGEKAKPRFQQKKSTSENLSNKGVFTREYFCHDIYQGIENLAETYGFAGVEPNTVLMGWASRSSDTVRFVQMIKHIIELDLNLLLMNYDTELKFGNRKTIDIWWRGSGNNGNLAINLVKFLWLSEGWKDSRLRLMIENPVNDERENIFNFASEVLDNLRVDAEIVIINNEIEKNQFYDIVRIESSNSDIVFMGIPDIKDGREDEFAEKTFRLCEDLGTVVLIKASTQFKRLNIGLKHTAVPVLTKSTKVIEQPNLAKENDLQWPDKAQVAIPIKEFAEKTFQLNQSIIDKSFGKILGQSAETISNAQSKVNATFVILSKRLPNNDQSAGDTANVFYKLNNNTFSRYKQILNELKDSLLSEQHKNLDVFFRSFDSKCDDLLKTLPEKIEISLDANEIKKHAAQAGGAIWLTSKLFLAGGKNVRIKVPFRKIIQYYYPQTWHHTRRRLWQKFSTISRQYISEQQKAFKEFRDSLHTLENALNKNTLDQEMINQERIRIEQVFSTLTDYLYASKSSLLEIADEENKYSLNQICNLLNTPNPQKTYKRKKYPNRIKKHELRSMESFPNDWKQVQELYINENILELTLSGVEYKLWHFLKRATEELKDVWNQTEEKKPLQLPPILIEFVNKSLALLQVGKPLSNSLLQPSPDNELPKRIKEIEDTTQERLNAALSRIPSHVELLKPHAMTDFAMYRLTVLDTQTVEVSKLLHFILQNNFLVPMQHDLKQFAAHSRALENKVLEINRLIKITLTFDKEEPLQMSLESFFEEQKIRTLKVQEKIDDLLVSIHDKLQGALNKTTRHLSLTAFLKTAENLKLLEKDKGNSIQKDSRFSKRLKRTKDFFRRNLVKVWYDRSRRIVYASQARSDKNEELFPISKLHALNENVSAQEEILATIPPYYQQLFLRKNNYFMDFWHGKPWELEQAEKTILRHNKGYNGALMVRGEHNSGKTFFVNYVVHQYLEKRQVFSVNPPFAGSASETEFVRALQKATENYNSIKKTFENLPEKSVVIIEDLELWWEKTNQGMKVIKLINELIETYGSKILFIITANSHAYRSINRFVRMDSHLLGTIDCKPFNAEELKNIIIQRHRSGNLQFNYKGKKEHEMRSWDFAQLFNTYFNYTRGNVGLTLQTWMANIYKTGENIIYIKPPRRPDTDVLNKLTPETLIFLVQFILHKRLNHDKLQRIMLMTPERVREKIKLLKRAAIIIEPNQGVYTLNPNLHAFIRERLIEKELL